MLLKRVVNAVDLKTKKKKKKGNDGNAVWSCPEGLRPNLSNCAENTRGKLNTHTGFSKTCGLSVSASVQKEVTLRRRRGTSISAPFHGNHSAPLAFFIFPLVENSH